jgi:hypothetical protein
MTDWDRLGRDEARDWQDSVDREWDRRLNLERQDERWVKGDEDDLGQESEE